MQMRVNHFNLDSQGRVLVPCRPKEASSLAEAREKDAAMAEFQELRSAMRSIAEQVSALKAMDGSQVEVAPHQKPPQYQAKPTLLQSLRDWGASRRHQAYQTEWSTWSAGGRDCSPQAGMVVTLAEYNRYGVDAEIKFSPRAEGDLSDYALASAGFAPKGVERARATWTLPEARQQECRERGSDTISYPASLSVTRQGDVERYELVTAKYGWSTGLGGRSLNLRPMEKQAESVLRLLINQATGTLVFERGEENLALKQALSKDPREAWSN
jgi:hypothetical protein